jgi:hypothetical protein
VQLPPASLAQYYVPLVENMARGAVVLNPVSLNPFFDTPIFNGAVLSCTGLTHSLLMFLLLFFFGCFRGWKWDVMGVLTSLGHWFTTRTAAAGLYPTLFSLIDEKTQRRLAL